jgi:NAD(P)-dependent dehydrogenase (short-subunit alcohol dehydrogenase family)
MSSRVINVASNSHHISGLNKDHDYNFKSTPCNDWVAYGQSKTANIYMANEVEERYGNRKLRATSVHPGAIMTGLIKNQPTEAMKFLKSNESMQKTPKFPEQGAVTTVWAAVGKECKDKDDIYLEDVARAEPGSMTETGGVGYANMLTMRLLKEDCGNIP